MKTTLELVKAIKAALTDPTHPEHDLVHKLLKKQTNKLLSKRGQISFRIKAIQKAQIRAEELIALAKNGDIRRFAKLDPVDGLTVLAVMANADEAARSAARSQLATDSVKVRHAKMNEAKAFVISEWAMKAHQYRNNKTRFATSYCKHVKLKFGVDITIKTITDRWLK